MIEQAQPITTYDEVLPFENTKGRNDRFTYAKVRIGDTWYFRKQAKHAELQTNLSRELLWSQFIQHVRKQDPTSTLDAPKVRGFDAEGALLTDYIDAPLVAEPTDPTKWIQKLDKYAAALVTLDTHSRSFDTTWPSSETLPGIKKVDAVFELWLGEHINKVPRLEEAKEYVKASIPHLTFCVQHGDLTPWQMFEKDDQWIIFDGEKAGDHLPRFNDLAYAYGRLTTRFRDRTTANKLLTLFLDKSSVDEHVFEAELMPIMTFRSVGMVADMLKTGDQAAIENSYQLLEDSLTKDLSQLMR